MSAISYLGTRSACLPIVGPFFSLLQHMSLISCEKGIRIANAVEEAEIATLSLRSLTATSAEKKQRIQEVKIGTKVKREQQRTRWLTYHEEGRLYAIYGITGSLLTIATIAAASRCFKFQSSPLKIGAFSLAFFTALILPLNIYLFNAHNKKRIKIIQTPICVNTKDIECADVPTWINDVVHAEKKLRKKESLCQ